jgi:hypothetical protein
MAGRPKVSITVLNGQLGQITPTADAVAGLLMTGIAATGTGGSIALGETKLITSVTQAEGLGLTAAYDTTNTTNVHKSIVDFFAQAGEGAELYINIVAKTNLMAAMCDTANNILKKLLNDANGRIRICAVTRVPDGAYTPVFTTQIDNDVLNAFPKAHALAEEFAAAFKPVRILLDGREFQGNTTTLIDLKGYTYNRVAGVLFTDVVSSKNASVGLVLGRLAAIPVQRNIGRVKDGDIGITNAYLTNQSALIDSLGAAVEDLVHDKGWIAVRKFTGKNGWFFNNDFTACANTDDYNHLGRGRVIDKAIVIAYQVFVEEILDDLDVDDSGRIDAGIIKDYQSKIKSAIDLQMTGEDEISSCRVVVDPNQNVLSTSKVKVQLFITPKFYSEEIAVELGFENPANA